MWIVFLLLASVIVMLERRTGNPSNPLLSSDVRAPTASFSKAPAIIRSHERAVAEKAQAQNHQHGGRERVLWFSEPQLGAVEVLFQGQRTTLMRDHHGRWFNHGDQHRHSENAASDSEHHHSDQAGAETIRKQLEISARMLADRRVVPDRELAAYGLQNPAAVFVCYGRKGNDVDFTQPLEVLHVGDLLTTEYTYYARLERETQLTLIPRYQIALLLKLAFGEGVAPTPMPERNAAS